jgi:hypothetical protein
MMEIGPVSEISCFKKFKLMANVQNNNQAKGSLYFLEILMKNFCFLIYDAFQPLSLQTQCASQSRRRLRLQNVKQDAEISV